MRGSLSESRAFLRLAQTAAKSGDLPWTWRGLRGANPVVPGWPNSISISSPLAHWRAIQVAARPNCIAAFAALGSDLGRGFRCTLALHLLAELSARLSPSAWAL